METRKKKSLVKKSLPGERQGAPGASAGCDRMRDVGGMELRSRAHANKYATTPKSSPEESGAPVHLEEVVNKMSNQDVQEPGPSHDNEEKHGIQENIIKSKRIPWTDREVEEIFRCYYITKKGTAFSQEKFYETWRLRNPTTRLNLDSKKLANQRRYFLKSGRISDHDLERIRKIVSSFTGQGLTEDHQQQKEAKLDQITHTDRSQNASVVPQLDVSDMVQSWTEKILRKFENLRGDSVKNHQIIPRIWENYRTAGIIKDVDSALGVIIQGRPFMDLSDIDHLACAAAISVTEEVLKVERPQDSHSSKPQSGNQGREAPWARRISRKIEKLRGHLSLLEEYWKGGVTRMKTLKTVKQLMREYNIGIAVDFPIVLEQLKQRIQAYAQRIRRYTKRVSFRKDNSMFNRNPGLFYRYLGNKTKIEVRNPNIEGITRYWSDLWENPSYYDKTAHWIMEEEQQYASLVGMNMESSIKLDEFRDILGKMANWKAAGIDGLQAFWIKRFTRLHEPMIRCFDSMLLDGDSAPAWLTEGRTFLIPKTDNPQDPGKYRPITCLPIIYKLLTSIISNRIYEYVVKVGVMPDEQLGCRRGSFGSKELVLLGRTIVEDAKKKKKNLAVAWLDYQKAFDSVPHDWIIRTLELFKIDRRIIRFCENTMGTWRTRLIIRGVNGMISSREISISRGIFQGDSLSPLLFCLALAPLSRFLRTSTQGYKLHRDEPSFTHAIYMDDLKLFSASDEGLEELLGRVGQFSKDICMKMGLSKCARAYLGRGILSHSENLNEAEDKSIHNLEPGESYRYLGIEEDPNTCDRKVRDDLKREYFRRLRLILGSQLNATNRMKAIGALAVPALEYSFAIVKWPKTELDDLDRKTRKLLNMNGMLHPRADVDRLYVRRCEGGRGLRQIVSSHQVAVVNMAKYLLRNQTQSIAGQIIRSQRKPGNAGVLTQALRIVKKVDIQVDSEELLEVTNRDNERQLEAFDVKRSFQVRQKQSWITKALHGRFIERIQTMDVDMKATFGWLQRGTLKSETEAFIVAAQDQALRTRNYERWVLRTIVDDRCRICRGFNETIDHIISGCPQLAKKEYLHRHNEVCRNIHWNVCRASGIKTCEMWYHHEPEAVLQGDECVILYDQQIHTDRKISANRPDMVIKDFKKKECYLIDVSTPCDNNVIAKGAEKILKYKDLAIEIQRMWNLRVRVVPVIIGALGVIPRDLHKNVTDIPGQIRVQKLQEIVLLGTAHILRKVLN